MHLLGKGQSVHPLGKGAELVSALKRMWRMYPLGNVWSFYPLGMGAEVVSAWKRAELVSA